MRNKLFLLILCAFLFVLTAGTAGAQDVDVESMDEAQLMQLLQEIMQRLGQETPPAETPTVLTPVIVPTSTPAPEEAGAGRVRVYQNKKLIIGSMPDTWFLVPTDVIIEHQYTEEECFYYCDALCRGRPQYAVCFNDCFRDHCQLEPPHMVG